MDKNFLIEKLNFIKKGGRSIDDLAISLSDYSKLNIEVEDIVEFISEYKSATSYWNSIQEKYEQDLKSNQDDFGDPNQCKIGL